MPTTIITSGYAATYLGIDADQGNNEPLLAMLCEAVNQDWQDYCGREFNKERHTEYHSIDRSTDRLFVRNPPVITLHSLTDDAMVASRAITVASNVHTNNGPNFGEVRLWNTEGVFTIGERSVKAVYTGGYADDDMPADLVLAAAQMVAVHWEGPEMLARRRQAIDGETIEWRGEWSPAIQRVRDKYRRVWTA